MTPSAPGEARPNVVLVPAERMERELVLRQKLRFRHAKHTGSLDAVVQVHCGKVSIVGLSPVGTRLFSITQQGEAIDVELSPGAAWPFPPEEILQAVHRTYLLPIAQPARSDGAHRVEVGSIRFVEVWQDGALLERQFPYADAQAGERALTVRYSGERSSSGIASRVALHDTALGYHLDIETSSVEHLQCGDELIERQ